MVLTRSQNGNNDDTSHDATTTNQNASTNNFLSVPNNNIKLKLPQFWTSCPHVWFIQIETQFQLHNIENDNIKYQYVITFLSQDAILKVLDIIKNPPIINKYDNIKKTLCERFSLDEESRFGEIIATLN